MEQATNDGERFSRAGSYVLGLMDKASRERAERDLEIDPAFREAVLKVAERLHVIELPEPDSSEPDHWKRIAARIADLPQMRGLVERPKTISPARKVKPVGQGLHAVPTLRAATYGIVLILVFAAGYLAALW
jgi:hypothetical protein